jgi:5-(carboxyamino)imidazole ribonucleotide synthase
VGGAPCIYEAFVDFECEVSAVVVRARDGDLRGWAVGRNEHRGGILRRTVVPAPGIDAAIAAEAHRAAGAVAESLGHVGVLAVEFFVTADGLVANEMAPRVHNSAHWTIDGSVTSQFANHVRAVCDEPLGSTDLVGPSAMVNLVGSMPDRADLLAVPGARLHDYAKAPRPGRKIGHVNVCAPDERVRDAQLRVLEELVDRAAAARAGVAGVGAPGAR